MFTWMMETANIERSEMYRTFNCGVGMILVVSAEDAERSIAALNNLNESAFIVGEVKAGAFEDQVKIV